MFMFLSMCACVTFHSKAFDFGMNLPKLQMHQFFLFLSFSEEYKKKEQ